MKEKKELSFEELENVNGGIDAGSGSTLCPKCGAICKSGLNIVTEGEGCDKQTYWLCPKCGHKW